MKFLLSIILWAMMPMLTPQGLQIGVVNINNKTIRIMKMNLNNPAFLQSAGNVKGVDETRFVFVEGQNQLQLSANGSVTIESVQGGEKVSEKYNDLSNTSVTINADSDTEVVVYGAVTKFAIYPPYPHNVLKSLDVSKNTALTELICYGCTGLTSLDVSKNTALTVLSCGKTGLTSLDVSKNTALTKLDCVDCTGLTSLDVSKNTALTELNCYGCTGLTSLDVSKNTALTELICYSCTGLTSLDVSKNTALTKLSCGKTGLTSLDVSKNTALTKLDCEDCTGLTSLDVSKNTALTELNCGDCTGLTSLDVSKNTALTELICYGCMGLMLLDIQNTEQLEIINIFDGLSTNLTTLQVAGTSAFAYEKVEGWLNGDAPNDGTILVDENTPQEVITAATAKNWTVEYVDAA